MEPAAGLVGRAVQAGARVVLVNRGETPYDEAVTLAGIADMGPILPPLSNIDADHHGAIRAAAQKLLATDRALARTPATVGMA